MKTALKGFYSKEMVSGGGGGEVDPKSARNHACEIRGGKEREFIVNFLGNCERICL